MPVAVVVAVMAELVRVLDLVELVAAEEVLEKPFVQVQVALYFFLP
jgi:hypothetical protein